MCSSFLNLFFPQILMFLSFYERLAEEQVMVTPSSHCCISLTGLALRSLAALGLIFIECIHLFPHKAKELRSSMI